MRRGAFTLLVLSACAHVPAESAVPGWTLLSASPGTEELQVPTDGHLRRMRATGVVAGAASTFWMSPSRIRGSVGPCRFDLVWGEGMYTGGRTCGPHGEPVSVLFPPALAGWSDPEAAALLAIMVQR